MTGRPNSPSDSDTNNAETGSAGTACNHEPCYHSSQYHSLIERRKSGFGAAPRQYPAFVLFDLPLLE